MRSRGCEQQDHPLACGSVGTGTWLPHMRRTEADLLATANTQRRDPAAQFTAGADIQLAASTTYLVVMQGTGAGSPSNRSGNSFRRRRGQRLS